MMILTWEVTKLVIIPTVAKRSGAIHNIAGGPSPVAPDSRQTALAPARDEKNSRVMLNRYSKLAPTGNGSQPQGMQCFHDRKG